MSSYFPLALGVSLLAHGAVYLSLPYLSLPGHGGNPSAQAAAPGMEVTFHLENPAERSEVRPAAMESGPILAKAPPPTVTAARAEAVEHRLAAPELSPSESADQVLDSNANPVGLDPKPSELPLAVQAEETSQRTTGPAGSDSQLSRSSPAFEGTEAARNSDLMPADSSEVTASSSKASMGTIPDIEPLGSAAVGSSRPAPATLPQYQRNPRPRYPHEARMRGEEGVVLLRVSVDERGKPVGLKIQESSGFSRLDEAALDAVQRWRFIPARLGNLARMSEVEIPITFRLTESQR